MCFRFIAAAGSLCKSLAVEFIGTFFLTCKGASTKPVPGAGFFGADKNVKF